MNGFAKAQIVGVVSRKPEQRDRFVNYSVATKRTYVKDGEQKEISNYHNVKAFGKGCEEAMALNEGDLVAVEGNLETESWMKDGSRQYRTVVGQSSVTRLAGGSDSRSSRPAASKSSDSGDSGGKHWGDDAF